MFYEIKWFNWIGNFCICTHQFHVSYVLFLLIGTKMPFKHHLILFCDLFIPPFGHNEIQHGIYSVPRWFPIY